MNDASLTKQFGDVCCYIRKQVLIAIHKVLRTMQDKFSELGHRLTLQSVEFSYAGISYLPGNLNTKSIAFQHISRWSEMLNE